MKGRLESIRIWLQKRWWGRNLANFITVFRPIGIFVTLFAVDLTIHVKLLWYVFWESTDALDGPVARWLKNKESIGRVLDPVADKVSKIFILVFFLENQLLEKHIIGLILLGESFVLVIAGYGIYLALKLQIFSSYGKSNKSGFRKILAGARDIFLERWGVNLAGKIAMIFYFIMAALIFIHIEFARNGSIVFGYKLAFWGGLAARAVSIPIYGWDLYKAQNELFR